MSEVRLEKLFRKWEDYIKKETNSQKFEPYPKETLKFNLEKEINLDNQKVKIGIRKL